MPGFKNKILFDSDLVKEKYATKQTSPGWSLSDVQEAFKGQEVFQPSPNGPIYIKTEGGKYIHLLSDGS